MKNVVLSSPITDVSIELLTSPDNILVITDLGLYTIVTNTKGERYWLDIGGSTGSALCSNPIISWKDRLIVYLKDPKAKVILCESTKELHAQIAFNL